MAIWWDLRERRVLNSINLVLALTGVTLQICLPGAPGLWSGVIGGLTAGGLLLLPFYFRIYRGGDVKLMMAVGIWVGGSIAAWMVLLGICFGGLLGAFMLRRADLRAMVRQGGLEPAVRPKSAHVPMALAFGVGTLTALWVPPPWLS